MEPILTFLAMTFLEKEYVTKLYNYVWQLGGLIIIDEVQTGVGRIGTHFWAFEMHELVPDIVISGKPLGNSFPMGMLATKSHIAKCMRDQLSSVIT